MDAVWAQGLPGRSAGRPEDVRVDFGHAETHPTRARPPSDGSIFSEDWWLEAACGDGLRRIQVERDGQAIGELSFAVKKRWGLTFLEMPPLTRTLSPRITVPDGKPVTQRVHVLEVVEELVAKLPPHDRLELIFAPDCVAVQGFVQLNFVVTHTYTYRSPIGVSADDLLAGAHKKTRNVITRARQICELEHGWDVERFIRLHAGRYGKTNRTDYDVVRRIFTAARSRNQAEILFVVKDGVDAAASILIWDAGTVYYWLTARDPNQSSTGANSFAIYEAMRMAQAGGRRLDLDGYGSPQGSLFLLKFGLEPAVRPFINRSTAVWKTLNLISFMGSPDRVDRHYRV